MLFAANGSVPQEALNKIKKRIKQTSSQSEYTAQCAPQHFNRKMTE